MEERATLRFHVGGFFNASPPNLKYIGGAIHEMTDIDPDYVCFFNLKGWIEELLGSSQVSKIYYKAPNAPLGDGVKILYDDKSVSEILPALHEYKVVDIYSEYEGGTMEGPLTQRSVVTGNQGEGQSVSKTLEVEVMQSRDIEMSDSQAIHVEVMENEELRDKPNGIDADIDITGDDEYDFANPVYDEWNSDKDDEEFQTVRNHVRAHQREGPLKDNDSSILDGNNDDDIVGYSKEIDPINEIEDGGTREVDGDGLEYWDSSDCGSFLETSEEEDDALRKKKKFPTFDKSSASPDFQLSMTFQSRREAKHAITLYSVKARKELKIVKNESTRVTAKCSTAGCPWKISIIYDEYNHYFQVKTYVADHTCHISFVNKLVNSKFLAKYYYSRLKAAPSMKLREFKEFIKEDIKVEVSISQCRRARLKVRDHMQGSYKDEYKKLWDYTEELRRSNEGSSIYMQVDRTIPTSKPQFRRFYVCFDACKKGFLAGCRRVIGLDGCFLKGPCKGEVLSAIGKDGNNQMYPIAWAVVEVENTNSWTWFLNNLRDDLGLEDGYGWAIMSDQQKGLLHAVEDLLPKVEQRMCARHIYANWRKKYKSKAWQLNFWQCARSTTIPHFERALKELKDITKDGADDLLKIDPKHWCRAFFSTSVKCDMVDNNISETFNGWILEARHKPIISMLEEIRVKVMTRIKDNRRIAERWNDNCARICTKLNRLKEESAFCHLDWNGKDGYEIRHRSDRFTVNMDNRTCSCRAWDLSGIPCPHAICAIYDRREKPETYICQWYKKEVYLKTYSFYLETVNGSLLWPKTGYESVQPPPRRVMPGRPKLQRRRDESERDKNTKMSKVGIPQRCTQCNGVGHNRRCCTQQAQSSEVRNGSTRGRGGRNRGRGATCRGRGRSQIQSEGALGRKRNVERGYGTYFDTETGAMIWNPGRSSERVISEANGGRVTQGSASTQSGRHN